MAKWWWNDPQTWEALQFKRVPQGWIYRSPIQWWPFGLGPHVHFLISDAQKDEIGKAFGRWSWHLVGAMVLVFVPGLILLWVFRDLWVSLQPTALLGFFLYGFCAQYVLSVCYWLMLRPLLANAQPTSERIRLSEQYKTWAEILPRGFLIFYTVFFVVMLIFFGYVMIKTKAWDLASSVSIIFVAGGAALTFMLLAAKRRAKQN